MEEPQVIVSGEQPPIILKTTTRCVIDMTEEDRDEFFRGLGEERFNHYLENKKAGVFNKCRKTDWCKVEREKKEKKEKEDIVIAIAQNDMIDTLTSRNQVLENHARTLTRELDDYRRSATQDLAEYKKLTEARFEKLTNLFLSMNK